MTLKKKKSGKVKKLTKAELSEGMEEGQAGNQADLKIDMPTKEQDHLMNGEGGQIDTTQLSKKQLFLIRPPNRIVTLISGPFPGRNPSVFFPYPLFLNKKREIPHN